MSKIKIRSTVHVSPTKSYSEWSNHNIKRYKKVWVKKMIESKNNLNL